MYRKHKQRERDRSPLQVAHNLKSTRFCVEWFLKRKAGIKLHFSLWPQKTSRHTKIRIVALYVAITFIQSKMTSIVVHNATYHQLCSTFNNSRYYLSGFKNPVASAIIINLVPPTEANQQSPCDILEKVRYGMKCNLAEATTNLAKWKL